MNSIVSFSAIVLIALAICTLAKPQDGKYTTKYDNVDIDQILKSDRLLNNYVKCLLDKGTCTPDGAELKRVLPDALETDCSKCSEKQKEGTKKVIHYLIDNKRSTWDELAVKYDPEGVYLKKYQNEAKKENINI